MSIDPIIEQLKAARIEAGLSQSRLAKLSGLHPSTVCEAEAGKHATTLPKLRRWARTLGQDLALIAAAGPGSTSPEPGPLRPTNCEQCDCQQHRWNGYSCMLRTDPPETCECGHLTSRHVFRRESGHSTEDGAP